STNDRRVPAPEGNHSGRVECDRGSALRQARRQFLCLSQCQRFRPILERNRGSPVGSGRRCLPGGYGVRPRRGRLSSFILRNSNGEDPRRALAHLLRPRETLAIASHTAQSFTGETAVPRGGRKFDRILNIVRTKKT